MIDSYGEAWEELGFKSNIDMARERIRGLEAQVAALVAALEKAEKSLRVWKEESDRWDDYDEDALQLVRQALAAAGESAHEQEK